jgi:hypothetical protein
MGQRVRRKGVFHGRSRKGFDHACAGLPHLDLDEETVAGLAGQLQSLAGVALLKPLTALLLPACTAAAAASSSACIVAPKRCRIPWQCCKQAQHCSLLRAACRCFHRP